MAAAGLGTFMGGAGVALGAAGVAGIIGAAMGKCVSTPIISVGCGSNTKISIDTTKITEIINEAITKNTTSVEQDATNVQELKVVLSGVQCKNIRINQTATIHSSLQAEITNDVINQPQTDILNMLNQKIDTMDKSTLEMLAPQGSQNLNADIKTYVKTAVTNTFTTDNINTIKNKLLNFQKSEIIIQNTVCENLDINQELVVGILSTAITYNLVQNLMKNKEYSKIVQDTINKIESEAKGLNSIIDSIMNMLKMYGIVIAVIVVAAIIGFVIFAQGGGLKDLQELKNGYYYF